MKQIIEKVICINPGYLSRGESNGTYVKMTIHPLAEALIVEKFTENLVYRRTRVEIIRI